MCGMVGYIGKSNGFLKGLKGLKRLEYREYVVLERGCETDKPRNLAKSVTVEQ